MNGTDRIVRQAIEFFHTSGEIGAGVDCLYAIRLADKDIALHLHFKVLCQLKIED